MPQPHDLDWTSTGFGPPCPKWAINPEISTIEQLARKHLNIGQCSISFLAEGTFNKVYKLESSRGSHVFRVSMPLRAPNKVASEVSTMKVIRDMTSIPTPKVIAFEATGQNELRYPWILMEFVHGVPIGECWKDLPAKQKSALIRCLARYQSELFSLSFDKVGSMYASDSNAAAGAYSLMFAVAFVVLLFPLAALLLALLLLAVRAEACHEARRTRSSVPVGPGVDRTFLHVPDAACPGPYLNSYHWLRARLESTAMVIRRGLNQMAEGNEGEESDEDDEPHPDDVTEEQRLDFIAHFRDALHLVFPPDEQERTGIIAHDWNAGNILVDDGGNITAILDWEFTMVGPSWLACQLPTFMRGNINEEDPGLPDDDDKYVEFHWLRVLDFEMTTQYRPLFVSEMKRLQPEWVRVFESSRSQRHCYRSLLFLEAGSGAGKSGLQWLNQVREGKPISVLYPDGNEY